MKINEVIAGFFHFYLKEFDRDNMVIDISSSVSKTKLGFQRDSRA